MRSRGTPSLLFIYLGVLAAAVLVMVVGFSTLMKASMGVFPAAATEKTSLQLQVERSREIRRALAVPVTTAPLPPITARPAREPAAVAESKKPMQVRLSREARDAMAMEQNAAPQAPRSAYTPVDRHSSVF